MTKVTIIKMPNGLAVDAEQISMNDIPLLLLDGYVHMVKMLLKEHDSNCDCEVMKFHKNNIDALASVLNKDKKQDAAIKKMFSSFGKEENG